jgi:hypothetical protein
VIKLGFFNVHFGSLSRAFQTLDDLDLTINPSFYAVSLCFKGIEIDWSKLFEDLIFNVDKYLNSDEAHEVHEKEPDRVES